MASSDGENSTHVSNTEYNKDANPFYPSSYNYPYFVRFSNLPLDINESHLKNLLDSIIMNNFDESISQLNQYKIVEFNNSNVQNNNQRCFAIIEILHWDFGARLIELMNGYEWLLKHLEAQIITNDMYDSVSYGSLDRNNSYYSGYYPNFPYTPVAPMNYNYIPSPQQSAQMFQMPQQSSYPSSYMSRRSSKSSDSRRNSRNSTSSSRPLPSFITNLVNENASDSDGSKSDVTNDSNLPATSEFIVVKNDEGQSIKVNPCRLFIGNIPFSSTWTTLKNFLVLKSEEIEPGNNILILRVEIPMQLLTSQHNSSTIPNPGLNVNLNKLNSYQFLSSFLSGNIDNPVGGRMEDSNTQPSRGLSRGFAIVTTGNKESLDKLIEYFDNVEFENRSLTVRYDKFPDFNNYILQQLNTDNNRNNFKEPSISSLAFERNLFQQKIYYGNPGYPSMVNGYMPYPIYYNNPMYYPAMNYTGPFPNHPQYAPIVPNAHPPQPSNYTSSPLNEYGHSQPHKYPLSNISHHDIPRNKTNSNPPTEPKNSRTPRKSEDTLHLSDDEKARELVNSFRSLGLSSN
ncbi:uncharacterized protein AC631_04095 [Debaryomyces fabryi]|uniref:RRM domain-containing protein n=1 Tax=Debaryomyces fabryi TaxID=58627 RepID=A0A0V1PV64_9ASCO|nr:uncharacterized protein AC631_04095 [Debaryomyces fabryi]KSA00136.1 hypothetical protein AC631_04095 [Debaryomyces fabryi]CUM47804.1 unnamed protein product [Debaryomyces fabryi]